MAKKPRSTTSKATVTESRATTNKKEFFSVFSKLVAQAWSDYDLKRRLLRDAMEVFNDIDAPVPDGITFKVVEEFDESTNTITLLLPPKPSDIELVERYLDLTHTHDWCARPPTCCCRPPH